MDDDDWPIICWTEAGQHLRNLEHCINMPSIGYVICIFICSYVEQHVITPGRVLNKDMHMFPSKISKSTNALLSPAKPSLKYFHIYLCNLMISFQFFTFINSQRYSKILIIPLILQQKTIVNSHYFNEF